jgi:hypothetical protein
VFQVTQGPCATSADGSCFTSPNWPASYGANERCTILVSADVSLSVQSFYTESGDVLTAAGIEFSYGGTGLEGLVVRAGDNISWSSDDWDFNSFPGFNICSGGTSPDQACHMRS